MHYMGIFSLPQRLDHVMKLLAENTEITVHYRGKVLGKLVPIHSLVKPKIADYAIDEDELARLADARVQARLDRPE
jgi:hypothetical protein